MRLLPLLLTLVAAGAPAPKFTWRGDLDVCLEEAAAESRVVFVAVDHAEEGRCEAFLKLTGDKAVAAAAAESLNVIASSETHGKRDTCKRFKGLACSDHQRVEADLVGGILQSNDLGTVAVPQYLWLDGQGEVLLSVAFEIDRAGLLWCFETAHRLVDPEGAQARSSDSRPPRRLLMGETYKPVDGDAMGRGMTPDELEVAMQSTKGNIMGLVPVGEILAVVFTDHPDAVGYAVKNLGFALESFARRRIPASVHTTGRIAPARFWEVAEQFAEDDLVGVRHEVAVALEQLGAEDALKLAKSGWKDEEVERARGAWLRGLAASGPSDKGVRKMLLKVVEDDDESSDLRASAAFALGYLERHEDIHAAWTALLTGDVGSLKVAAACGVALARDEGMLRAVEDALVAAGGSLEDGGEDSGEAEAEPEPDEDSADSREAATSDADALARARAVLLGGNLHPIENDVRRVTGDDLPRERIFFKAVGEAVAPVDDGGGRGGR